MTLKQARARYKQVFKSDAPEELSIADIESKLEAMKAEKAKAKADVDAAKPAESAKAVKGPANSPKYKARFGVIIEGMGKFTKAEIEASPEVIQYLVEIGSPAVIKL